MMLTFIDPREWWLELSATAQAEAIRQSQPCSTPASRHRAYLNALCLNAVLGWIREDVPEASPWSAMMPPIWEVVNGTTILLGSIQLVLIPTEAIDTGELAVPQEWVDIPSWVGDYYLAVQVQAERGWIRIWGYTTHQELKAMGSYDASDRTYSLNADQLTRDLNAFWVTVQVCEAETRSAIAPLPELASVQAESLIQRLGDVSVVFPRLAVPFTLWGALLEQETWRQQLFQRRVRASISAAATRVSEWLQGSFAAAWQAIEAVVSPQQVAIAWRDDSEPTTFDVSRVKVLEFGSPGEAEQIALIMGITLLTESQVAIGLQVCPTGDNLLLPSSVQIRLLDEVGNEIEQASAAITETIQLRFEANLGERFRVEVISGKKQITEEFEV